MKSSAKIFGRNLRAARQARGLTQVEMARRLGVAPPYLCRVEYGREGLRLLQCERLAKGVGVSLHTLFTEEK